MGCPFLLMPMKPQSILFIALTAVILSCSKIEERFVPTNDSLDVTHSSSPVLLSDSLVAETIAKSISPDSVRLIIELFDANGAPLNTPMPVTFVDDSYSEELLSDGMGTIERLVHRNHTISLLYGDEVVTTYFDMKGGEELNDHIRLNILPMRGRIMDQTGLPHKQMPVHVHYRYGKKDRTMACEKDLMFRTDSSGYYRTYVSADFYSMVFRSCGFSFGVVSHKEFKAYPKQNFIFDPFDVENRCAYNVPRHDYFLEIPFSSDGYTESVKVREWDSFFAMDEILESSEYTKLRVVFPHRSYSYKLKKKGGAFRAPVIKVCIK